LTGVLRAVSPTLLVFLSPEHSSDSTESAASSPDPDHFVRRPLRLEAGAVLQQAIEPNEFIITGKRCGAIFQPCNIPHCRYPMQTVAQKSCRAQSVLQQVGIRAHVLQDQLLFFQCRARVARSGAFLMETMSFITDEE
jgi:hypothetical protein